MAKTLADRYEAQGLDPNLAYSQDDDADFRADFGI